jgi:hypothetical protein
MMNRIHAHSSSTQNRFRSLNDAHKGGPGRTSGDEIDHDCDGTDASAKDESNTGGEEEATPLDGEYRDGKTGCRCSAGSLRHRSTPLAGLAGLIVFKGTRRPRSIL